MTFDTWAVELWLLLSCIIAGCTLTNDRLLGPTIGIVLWITINFVIIWLEILKESALP